MVYISIIPHILDMIIKYILFTLFERSWCIIVNNATNKVVNRYNPFNTTGFISTLFLKNIGKNLTVIPDAIPNRNSDDVIIIALFKLGSNTLVSILYRIQNIIYGFFNDF